MIWDAFPGAQGTRFEEEYRRAMSESVSVAFEAYYDELDLWLEVHAYPSDEGLAIYFQDIGQRVKALFPQTLQILLSGYTDLQTITTAVNEGGIYKFLTKPWDDDELRVIVQQAVREAAIQNARSRRQGRDGPP